MAEDKQDKMAEDKQDKMAEDKQDKQVLIKKAMGAYGIPEKYLLGSNVTADGEVVLVTRGGKKVRWRDRAVVVKLTDVEITGIPPADKKKK